MNIYDVSRKAGVSIATVSRVLNNSAHVSDITREKVLSVIEENGYVPNAFARGLGLNTMRTIGLLCPDASDPYQSQALNQLEKNFRSKGYDCLLICSGKEPEAKKAGVESLLNRHVDGIVLMGSSFIGETDEENQYMRQAAETIPVVVLNGSCNVEGVYCVLCDDEKASREAAEYLLRTGKRRILFLHHSNNYSGRKKLAGYRAALEKSGIGYDPRLVRMAEKDFRSIEKVGEMLEKLDREGLGFDAVFCSEDMLAVGALKYARGKGFRIPGDLSVIGYNNSVYCLCSDPEISSVDNRLDDICEKIAEIMTGVLDGHEMSREVVFDGRLIIRGSTSAIE